MRLSIKGDTALSPTHFFLCIYLCTPIQKYSDSVSMAVLSGQHEGGPSQLRGVQETERATKFCVEVN